MTEREGQIEIDGRVSMDGDPPASIHLMGISSGLVCLFHEADSTLVILELSYVWRLAEGGPWRFRTKRGSGRLTFPYSVRGAARNAVDVLRADSGQIMVGLRTK